MILPIFNIFDCWDEVKLLKPCLTECEWLSKALLQFWKFFSLSFASFDAFGIKNEIFWKKRFTIWEELRVSNGFKKSFSQICCFSKPVNEIHLELNLFVQAINHLGKASMGWVLLKSYIEWDDVFKNTFNSQFKCQNWK